MANVQQKHLEGLVYRTAEKKDVVDSDGVKKQKSVSTTRPLMIDDILSARDDGDPFHIVAKDGRKYDVPKTPPPRDAGKEG